MINTLSNHYIDELIGARLENFLLGGSADAQQALGHAVQHFEMRQRIMVGISQTALCLGLLVLAAVPLFGSRGKCRGAFKSTGKRTDT